MVQRNTFSSLTSLKGIFILVVAFHNTMLVHPLFDAFPGTAFLTAFGGALGNSMFFALSGFCMSCGYRDRISSHAVSFKDFLWKRLKKLYPLYFITNIAALFLDIVRYGMSAINLEKIASTLLLKMGGGLRTEGPYNAPTWFLCTLFLCYVVFFFLCYHSKTATHYYCAIALAIILGRALATADLSFPFCSSSNGLGLMNFFIGCALAEVYPRITQRTHKWAAPLSFFTLLFAFCLFWKYGTEIICGNVSTAFAFVITPLIICLALVDGPCKQILQLKPLVYLGKISGSIFFWHLVVYYAFSILFSLFVPGQTIQETHYLLYFVTMIAWSIASYSFLERSPHRDIELK